MTSKLYVPILHKTVNDIKTMALKISNSDYLHPKPCYCLQVTQDVEQKGHHQQTKPHQYYLTYSAAITLS